MSEQAVSSPFTRHQLIRARVSLRETDDAALEALAGPLWRFEDRCEQMHIALADAAKELGFRLEPLP